jgi:hypothetical protein
MPALRHRVEASGRIAAPASRVFSILADFKEGHQAILPDRHFRNFRVVSGGTGAGTVMEFDFHLGGRVRKVRSVAAEPEPGRLLTETDREHDTTTTFRVDPDGEGSIVTIGTEFPVRPGLAGAIERWMSTQMLRKVYRLELEQLARYAAERL